MLQRIYLLLTFIFCSTYAFSQVYLDASISGDTIYTCDTLFYDSGGPSGAMTGGGNYHVTFCPNDPDDYTNIRFDFNNGQNDLYYKRFEIYDGASTSATEIYDTYDDLPNYRYKLSGSTFYAGMSGSGDGSNCLTFRIESSASYGGWAARIFCTETNEVANDEICDAIPLILGSEIEGTNNFATRTCVAGAAYAVTNTSYDYGYYATHTTYRQNVGDVFYSFIAPTSGQITVSLQRNPTGDDDFIPYIKLFSINNCSVDCTSNTASHYTGNIYSLHSHPSSATATIYYTTYTQNGQVTYTYSSLVQGREYFLAVGGSHYYYSNNSISLNGNACGEPGVWTGDYTLEVSDGRPFVDGTTNCNLLIAPANDTPCGAFDLGVECNKANGSTVGGSIDPCSDISYQKLTGASSNSTAYSATTWYKYSPAAAEIGKSHSLTVTPSTCYTRTSTSCDYDNDGSNETVYALTESSSPRILFAILEVDTTATCSDADIASGNAIANAGTTGSSTTTPISINFTPQAGKDYYLVTASNVAATTGYFCDYEIEVDVYEDLSVNGGLPSGYICDFPDSATASVTFEVVGGRGDYLAYFKTDSTAIATWTSGEAETSSARIDTINGQGFFTISNISDGESWSVEFDDSLGCTYYEGATYDYNLWCNKCDGYVKLNIVQPDTAACPGEEIFMMPTIDASVPEPYYAGGSFNRYFKTTYGSGARSYFYNNDGSTSSVLPSPEMEINESTISGGAAQVEEICVKVFSYYWNFITLDIELDGCGSKINIWKGNRVGGSDAAPGGYYGYGYQTFCITTGWKSNTYGVETGSWSPGTAAINAAWNGCDPETPVKLTSSGGWAYYYLYAYNMTMKMLDYRNTPVAAFNDGYALQWIPETTANTPFSPSISDGSELSYDPFKDPDSLTATFAETVPGTYAYHLVTTDVNGCEVGQGVNHGGPTGQGRFEIQVYNNPTIDEVTYNSPLCFGGKTDIDAKVTAGDNTIDDTFGYKWTITGTTGDAAGFLTSDNTNSTTLLTSGTGTVTFNLTLTDERGCSDTYSDTITINPDCPAEAGQY